MSPAKPVRLRELCERLDITPDTFYRTRGRLHVRDKLPAPLTCARPFKWDRATIDAWFARHHPAAPRALVAANDATPPMVPASDAEHRDYLRRVYGAQR